MLGSGRVFWLYWHYIDLNFKDCSAAGFCWNTDSITEFHKPQESSSSKCPWFFLCVQRLATKRDALKPIIAEKLKHNRVLSWAWQSAMYNWKPMESLQSHLKISCQAAFGVCKLVLDLPTKNASAKNKPMATHSPCSCRGSTSRSQRCGCGWSDENIWRQGASLYQHPTRPVGAFFLNCYPRKNALQWQPQLWSIWRAGELNQN